MTGSSHQASDFQKGRWSRRSARPVALARICHENPDNDLVGVRTAPRRRGRVDLVAHTPQEEPEQVDDARHPAVAVEPGRGIGLRVE